MNALQLSSFGTPTHGSWLNRWLASTPQETIVRTYKKLAALAGSGTLAAPIEATYALSDYREAIGHAARGNRHGKVLFTFQMSANRVPDDLGGLQRQTPAAGQPKTFWRDAD